MMDLDDRRARRRPSSEGNFQEIVERSPDPMFVHQGMVIRYVNPALLQLLGYDDAAELVGKTTLEAFIHPDDRAVLREFVRGRDAGETPKELTIRWVRHDGTALVVDAVGIPIAFNDGPAVLVVARDTTERRKIERQLEDSLSLLRATLESTADGILVVDAAGKIVGLNQRFTELWRIPSAITESRDDASALAFVMGQLKDPEQFVSKVRALYDQPDAESEDTLDFLDGRVFERYSRPQRVADACVGRVWSFRDITARRRAEDAVLQANEELENRVRERTREIEQIQARLLLSDRMASVGTLAAGIAHEINNPMGYVMANLEMIAEGVRGLAGAATPEAITDIEGMIADALQGAERVRKIVRGMKTFSRPEQAKRSVLDVRNVLEVSINMAFNEIRHHARLVKDYGDVPPVEVDEAQLVQVFINLLVNAAQSIPEGRVDRNEIRIVTRKDRAGRVEIEVRDTGAGISPEALGHIFDPFFTTKPIGVGTGLGLSICHNIIVAQGGELCVESVLGAGSVFRVVLPAAPDVVVAPAKPESATTASSERRGKILIVDDDRMLADALRRILRAHDVAILATGRKALEHLTSGATFDVVFCDLMMPEMTGMDLYAELARNSYEQLEQIVFMTGGAFTPAARAFLDRVPNENLDKPFDSRSVRALVQRRLR
jgi:PAS domain S-box-containing protein